MRRQTRRHFARTVAMIDTTVPTTSATGGGGSGQEAAFVRVIEGEDAMHDLRWDQMRYQLSGAKGPYVGILGFAITFASQDIAAKYP